MYRALTLKVIEEKIDPKDVAQVIDLASKTGIELLNYPDSPLKVLLDGRDVTKEIRQPRITRLVSDIAKIKDIRQIMLKLQRKLGTQRDGVLEGRDIGTVVFPDAYKKFYLDAQFQERVSRRYKELNALGQQVSMEAVAEDLRNRDTIDSNRQFAPLKKAEDAIYIDTTQMTIKEVVTKILSYI